MDLIDLDAAGVIGKDFAGAKFRSGVLPPEIFCKLDSSKLEQYVRYWSDQINVPAEDAPKLINTKIK